MFLRYKNKPRSKGKQLETRLQSKRMSIFEGKIRDIVLILLHSELLPGQAPNIWCGNLGFIIQKHFIYKNQYVSSRGRITLSIITFKCQMVGNKVCLRRIIKETLDQIQDASTAQENPKSKLWLRIMLL